MFKFRFLSLFSWMLLIVTFAATTAFAEIGGIKIDDDGDCTDVDKQNNNLSAINDPEIWLNAPPGQDTTLRYFIYDHSAKTTSGLVNVTFTQCPDPNSNYYVDSGLAPDVEGDQFPAKPGGNGTFTITVVDDVGKIIGKDTWRQ